MTDLQTSLILTENNLKDLPNTFQSIAKNLMCNYVIKKGGKEYAIIEIEFYLYTPTHQDFITYPRNLKAGRWFFHQSGVDISFESKDIKIEKNKGRKEKVKLETNPIFGGILIRGLYRFPYTEDENKRYEASYIFGPQNV